MLVSGRGEETYGLSNAKVLLLFRINVRGSIECQEYAFSQYMVAISLINMVDESVGYDCIRCRTDDEVATAWDEVLAFWCM